MPEFRKVFGAVLSLAAVPHATAVGWACPGHRPALMHNQALEAQVEIRFVEASGKIGHAEFRIEKAQF